MNGRHPQLRVETGAPAVSPEVQVALAELAEDGATTQTGTGILPHWDSQRRVLYLAGRAVKRYRRPSPNQEAILIAFEEEAWPYRIHDPLPPKGEVAPKTRLHDTIKWLNRNQQHRLLRFLGDGTGEGVCWEAVECDGLVLPADRPANLRRAA